MPLLPSAFAPCRCCSLIDTRRFMASSSVQSGAHTTNSLVSGGTTEGEVVSDMNSRLRKCYRMVSQVEVDRGTWIATYIYAGVD